MKQKIVEARTKKQLERLEEVLASRISVPSNLPTNCLIHNGKAGTYQNFYFKGKVTHLHRLAYIREYGEIPQGQNVLHRCDRKECSEPTHLYLGSQSDNIKDIHSKVWKDQQEKVIAEIESDMQEFISNLNKGNYNV